MDSNKHILIVDDVADNIQIAMNILKEENYQFSFARTGNEALSILQEETNSFDLILLDIMMPGMDGFEVCQQLKASPRLKDIPVIFLTARVDAESVAKGFEVGGVDYVTKPFSPRELSARVKAVLRRTGERISPSPALPYQSTTLFKVDAEKMQISYHNIAIELSRTEYRLLKLLITTPGRVYSRDQLMDQAWEHSAISSDRTVDTHIKTIRHKIKTIHPESDPIVTHRGIGYSLRVEQ